MRGDFEDGGVSTPRESMSLGEILTGLPIEFRASEYSVLTATTRTTINNWRMFVKRFNAWGLGAKSGQKRGFWGVSG